MTEPIVVAVFVLVYTGMVLGELPFLALDRTGIALLGAIVLLATGTVTPAAAWEAVDVPTLGLLFGLMVVSAQLRLGGAYAAITRRLARLHASPAGLLAILIAVAAVLSAALANDIVVLAMTPVLVEGCARRGLDPVPFLLALACAANVGSAATLIGNPQNMLIGQTLRLSFAGYLAEAAVPVIVGCVAIWVIVRACVAGRWVRHTPIPLVEVPAFDRWQTMKGAVVVLLVVASFLFTTVAREVVALTAAGLLLTSRRMASRRILGLVDWNLLVLFVGLFVVNDAFAASGQLGRITGSLAAAGLDVARPPLLFTATVVLSNLVSNVPAVMLLLPSATHPQAGAILALASTLAGNLFIVGSIANLIVVDQAAALDVRITWRDHARVGIPVTLATLAIAAAWLAITA